MSLSGIFSTDSVLCESPDWFLRDLCEVQVEVTENCVFLPSTAC